MPENVPPSINSVRVLLKHCAVPSDSRTHVSSTPAETSAAVVDVPTRVGDVAPPLYPPPQHHAVPFDSRAQV